MTSWTTIGEVSKRLAPLTQFAENAGGLFGGFKLPGMGAAPKPATDAAAPGGPTPAKQSTTATKSATTSTARTAPAKKTAAKKTTAKKSTTKKSPRHGQADVQRRSRPAKQSPSG